MVGTTWGWFKQPSLFAPLPLLKDTGPDQASQAWATESPRCCHEYDGGLARDSTSRPRWTVPHAVGSSQSLTAILLPRKHVARPLSLFVAVRYHTHDMMWSQLEPSLLPASRMQRGSFISIAASFF